MARLVIACIFSSLFVGACHRKNATNEVPLVLSAYITGTFSRRIFELKVDSTFRYRRNVHGNSIDITGSWRKEENKFFLFNENGKAVFFIEEGSNKFSVDILNGDSTLIDLKNTNFYYRIQKHEPPITVNFNSRR